MSIIKKKPRNEINKGLELSDLVLFLARRSNIIVSTTTIFFIFSIIYAFFIAEVSFRSTSKIMSSLSSGSESRVLGFASQLGIDLPLGQSEPKWAYASIIKSRDLTKTLISKSFEDPVSKKVMPLKHILVPPNEKKMNSFHIETKAVDQLLDMISISEDIKTGIFTLSVDASQSNLAAEINKALIDALDSYQRDYNKKKTSETKKFIEERIQQTKVDLTRSEESLKNFRDKNRRIQNSPALLLEEQRLAREVNVQTSVFTTLKQQLETTKIEEVKKSDYVVIIDKPSIPITRGKPNRKTLVFIIATLGIFFGILLGILKDYFLNASKKDLDNFRVAKNMIRENINSFLKI